MLDFERIVLGKEFMSESSDSPRVNLFVVLLSDEYLRRQIEWRSTKS